MRLIDADATVTVQSFDPMNEEYSHDEMTVERALDFATDEGCPPTIDAIPVEWLQRRRDIYLKAYHAGHESEIHTAAILNDTLMAWRKEQEART